MKKTFWFDIFSEKVCKKLLYVLLPILVSGIVYLGGWNDNTDHQTDLPFRVPPRVVPERLEIFENVSPAVVLIATFDENNKLRGHGSGFFVSAKGYVVTNHHVIRGAYSATVRTIDGANYRVNGLIAADPPIDLAVLQVELMDRDIPVLELANTLPGWGDKAFVLGHPHGCELTLSEGMVRAGSMNGRISPECIRFEISAPVCPGSSGSPVLNEKGRVIGVVQSCRMAASYKKSGQGVTYAVAASNISCLEIDDKLMTLRKYALTTPSIFRLPQWYLRAGRYDKSFWDVHGNKASAYFWIQN